MIDYETFCKIRDCHDRQGLTIPQTARTLGLDPRTVAKWVARSRFEPRRSRPRPSVLDTFKPRITRLLDSHNDSTLTSAILDRVLHTSIPSSSKARASAPKRILTIK